MCGTAQLESVRTDLQLAEPALDLRPGELNWHRSTLEPPLLFPLRLLGGPLQLGKPRLDIFRLDRLHRVV